MKQIKFLLIVFASIAAFSFKSDNSCESFFPQKPGSTWVLTSYDAKDKISTVSKGRLINITDIEGGKEATINQEIADDKGKLLAAGDIMMRCTDDKFYMDMSNMFSESGFGAVENAEVQFSDQFMEYPSNPEAGQTLADASPTMTVMLNGVQIMSMTIHITNRKVEGEETITTPAGTFDCIKFSDDTEIKSMMMKVKTHNISWMAKNVGLVRMESYDDKGKLASKNILTSFTN